MSRDVKVWLTAEVYLHDGVIVLKSVGYIYRSLVGDVVHFTMWDSQFGLQI